MNRGIQIAAVIVFCMLLGGCPPKSDNNFPEGIKINNLAPVYDDGLPRDNVLKAINLTLHVIEIPVENFSKLDEIRRTLSIRPLKFNNQLAFSENYFSAYYGRNQTVNSVYGLLEIAGAQNLTTQGFQNIMLANEEKYDIPVQQLPRMQAVYFKNLSGREEAARIGPGFITMHIEIEKSITLDDYAKVTIFPLFTPMTTGSLRDRIPDEYKVQDNHQDYVFTSQDFAFTSAAMQLNMTPGDFIFLAPERYSSDESILSSLFFNNPGGSMFFNPQSGQMPERKPTVRVYLIRCLGMNL